MFVCFLPFHSHFSHPNFTNCKLLTDADLWRMRCSLINSGSTHKVKKSVKANLDHVSLNNQSHYSLDAIEIQSELCNTQSPFTDNIGMNDKCRKLNYTCHKKSVTSLIKQTFFFVRGKLQK